MRRIRIVLLHSQFKMQCPNFLHPPWWVIPLPDESARGQFLQGYSYPSKHVLYHHHPALNLTSTNQSVGSQWTIWLWHTHTHTCTNSDTRTHTYTQVLIHAPTNIHRRRCCWCRQERSVSPTLQLFALPAPRPHLQPNYQWALTWCNIRSKQPISFPINLQPKCQAQQYSGLPVIQNCIMYIMFIKNQATSQARTPAPSL